MRYDGNLNNNKSYLCEFQHMKKAIILFFFACIMCHGLDSIFQRLLNHFIQAYRRFISDRVQLINAIQIILIKKFSGILFTLVGCGR